jgi:DNA replication and repair protein RecF
MSLYLRHISVNNFRNYDSIDLNNLGNLVIFLGHNAVGKTNLIEAIQLLSSLNSFRNPKTDQLIKEGSNEAFLLGNFSDSDRNFDISLTIQPGKKTYYFNKNKRKIQDLKGKIPAVTFTPNDLELTKSSSRIKRDTIDFLGEQLSAQYYTVRRDYEKVVRYKNKLLHDEEDINLIESMNEMLCLCGAQLLYFRLELFKRLKKYIQENYQTFSNQKESFSSSYSPSWVRYKTFVAENNKDIFSYSRDELIERLEKAVDQSKALEFERKRSLIGPHADQIDLFINDKNVRDFASQGQQRSLVLAWKLAEMQVLEESLNQKPLLLLDDVMSELDEERREILISFFSHKTQTFITTTNLSYFTQDLLTTAEIISLPLKEKGEK